MPGSQKEVGLTYRELPQDVEEGDTLLLADGALELRVEKVEEADIHCRVILGGQLSSHKGINLPSRSIRAPILTNKDYEDLAFGLEAGRRLCRAVVRAFGSDIEVARAYMRAQGQVRPIIAKIEKHEALENWTRSSPRWMASWWRAGIWAWTSRRNRCPRRSG